MGTKDAEFLKKLLAMFKMEAREHLQVISDELAKMGKVDADAQAQSVEVMYREAHSLKGAARSVNLADIVALCQSLENVFADLKKRRMPLSPQTDDLLQQTIDYCYKLVEVETPSSSERAAGKNLTQQLENSISGQQPATSWLNRSISQKLPPAPDKPSAAFPEQSIASDTSDSPRQSPHSTSIPVASETIRIPTARLDALLLQAEEMISVKLATGQRVLDLRDLHKAFNTWKKDRQKSLSVALSRQRNSPGQLSTESFIPFFETRLTALIKTAEDDHRTTAAQIDLLLDDMKKTLMLPFSSMLELFPLFVRDLARAVGKKVELMTDGGEIEIDRRVLEEMKDPLIHLVRNCLDHGIEPPEERVRKKKSAYGKIRIGVTSRDSKIEITVADDGKGLDLAKIAAAATKQATASRETMDTLGEQEALLLIFQSGVTTSPLITDISGRGLGLAIVREKVEKLNGTIRVETLPDAGTTFRLVVPLTLATFRGTLVRISDQLFILPSMNVEKVARAKKETIQTVENRATLVFDGQPISLVSLGDVLGLKASAERQQADNPFVQVVLVGSSEKHLAFMVDEVLGEQEVLVKPLGRQLSRVRNIMGATVLGNGKVVPLLNIADLLKTVVKMTPSFPFEQMAGPEKSCSVLVAEDSITARMLLKNILESAGYEVQAVVDGVDAFAALKSREFDIVVSDVEMPRMDGFDLTAKIRADNTFSELPVVLVTALDSREDRERGIDVGANAYIVKSSFDQSNLLEVIGRLT